MDVAGALIDALRIALIALFILGGISFGVLNVVCLDERYRRYHGTPSCREFVRMFYGIERPCIAEINEDEE